MVPVLNWFERQFTFDLPVGLYPNIVERLRGTPARLTDRLIGLPREMLIQRDGDDWSIQEHAGHLLDLDELDKARLADFLAGRPTLTPADVQNRKTYAANHNADTLENILTRFRAERLKLVAQLDQFDVAFVQRTAIHPRLEVPMRVLDWAFFVAEHDDHHLAQINVLIRKLGAAR